MIVYLIFAIGIHWYLFKQVTVAHVVMGFLGIGGVLIFCTTLSFNAEGVPLGAAILMAGALCSATATLMVSNEWYG